MTVAESLVLFDEPQTFPEMTRGCGVGVLVSRTDHHADCFDAGRKYLLDQDAQGGLGLAVAVHQRLERQGPLGQARGRYDGFLDFHGY